jgi:hypothetical protein
MEGRWLILMMVVGGMTQYLATVQGMPDEVEEHLDRRIRSFLGQLDIMISAVII